MKVAHLVSYFNTNKLYGYLFQALDSAGVSQQIFSPRRIGIEPESSQSIETSSHSLWNKWDRILFRRKVAKYKQWLVPFIDSNAPDIIHSHTLYSDGFAAYQLNIQFDIPYVVTVRSTDLNVFAKYVWFLRPQAVEVLKNASNVVFVNHQTKLRLERYLNYRIAEDKVSVIPNGLSDFWIQPSQKTAASVQPTVAGEKKVVKIVCVAKVVRHKNHLNLIKSVIQLNQDAKCKYVLTIVGNHESSFGQRLKKRFECQTVNFVGVLAQEQIQQVFRQSDVFALVSQTETFGIVYLEAISQGLPVLYSSGQGFDGWDPNNKFGKGCKPDDIADICRGITDLAESGRLSAERIQDVKDEFSWPNVAAQMNSAYQLAMLDHNSMGKS